MDRRLAESGTAYVSLLANNLPRPEALELEAFLIREIKPRFNRQMNGAANAGRGEDNHNATMTFEKAEMYRRLYAGWQGSMRAFHREHLPDLGWSSVRKLLHGISYSRRPKSKHKETT